MEATSCDITFLGVTAHHSCPIMMHCILLMLKQKEKKFSLQDCLILARSKFTHVYTKVEQIISKQMYPSYYEKMSHFISKLSYYVYTCQTYRNKHMESENI